MSHESFGGYYGTSHLYKKTAMGCPIEASEATMGHPTCIQREMGCPTKALGAIMEHLTYTERKWDVPKVLWRL